MKPVSTDYSGSFSWHDCGLATRALEALVREPRDRRADERMNSEQRGGQAVQAVVDRIWALYGDSRSFSETSLV